MGAAENCSAPIPAFKSTVLYFVRSRRRNEQRQLLVRSFIASVKIKEKFNLLCCRGNGAARFSSHLKVNREKYL
jgi:hypothetical protein